MFAIAWDEDPDNPNPHALNLNSALFDTEDEARRSAEEEVSDEDATYYESGYVIIKVLDSVKLKEIRSYLLSQPCEGLTYGDRTIHPSTVRHDFQCLDIVPARTSHMCLRCRVLLYMDWTHGFPIIKVTDSVDTESDFESQVAEVTARGFRDGV